MNPTDQEILEVCVLLSGLSLPHYVNSEEYSGRIREWNPLVNPFDALSLLRFCDTRVDFGLGGYVITEFDFDEKFVGNICRDICMQAYEKYKSEQAAIADIQKRIDAETARKKKCGERGHIYPDFGTPLLCQRPGVLRKTCEVCGFNLDYRPGDGAA